MGSEPEDSSGCGTFAIAAVILIAVWVISSMLEARTFCRVTGQRVSTWEAMWVDLRVMSGPTVDRGESTPEQK